MTKDQTTVFVRNLPYGVTQEELETLFGEIGPVKKVSVIKERGKKKSDEMTRGFAFIKFAMEGDATIAIKKLCGREYHGRKMQCELANKKESTTKSESKLDNKDDISPPISENNKEEESKNVEMNEQIQIISKDQKEGNTKNQEPKANQSERNARRREHRALLRKVKENAELKADSKQKTLLIFGLNNSITKKHIYKKVKKIGKVVNVEVSQDKKNDKLIIASVEFQTLKDTDEAESKLNQHVFKGCTMTVRRLQTTAVPINFSTVKIPKKAGSSQLIIRNLSFEATDEDLKKVFGEVGPISEARVVRMPIENHDDNEEENTTKPLGRSRGFGFVRYYDVKDAEAAIEKLNQIKIKGRMIAVDFALVKSEYLKAKHTESVEESPEKEENDDDQHQTSNDEIEDGIDSLENDQEDDDEDNDEIDEDDEEDEEDDEEKDGDSDAEEEDNDNDDGGENENENQKPHKRRYEDNPLDRLRTLFIRNVSYQTSEDDLRECFEAYGAVEYAKIVMDHASGLSKGVGFVRMLNQEGADAAIEASKVQSTKIDQHKKEKKQNSTAASKQMFYNEAMMDGDGITLNGRVLIVTCSVSREEANDLTEKNKEKRERDRRNLYLREEGYVKVEELESGETSIPKVDVEKRKRAIKEKREKLKNPMFFFSPNRLSVRNLHHNVDDKTLRKLFYQAAVDGMKQKLVKLDEIKKDYQPKNPKIHVRIRMAKVIRDLENQKQGKDAKSRGYGFVEFEEHIHALAALRELNNNPHYTSYTILGSKQKNSSNLKQHLISRLIIEFALENHAKLKLREKRLEAAEKARQEKKTLKEAQEEQEETPKKRKGRGKIQREKKRQKQQEKEENESKEEEKKSTPSKNLKQPKTILKRTHKEMEPKTMETPIKKTKVPEKPKQVQFMNATPIQETKKSKKQLKKEKQRQKEAKFDHTVAEYKQQLFGDLKIQKESKNRWFD